MPLERGAVGPWLITISALVHFSPILLGSSIASAVWSSTNKVKGNLFIKFHDSESYAFLKKKKNVATRLAASLKRDVNSTNWPTKRESWKDKKYFLEANHRNYVREEQRKLTHDPSFIQSSMLPFPVHKNWKLNQPDLLAQNNLRRHCSQIFRQKG
jgi:hypothetical protein